jgi:hypothetical protein
MKTKSKRQKSDDPRHRTDIPGQNPKADDSAEKDENHDESRHADDVEETGGSKIDRRAGDARHLGR